MRVQKGFTLVEMSIVLVIIGLIVGGILAGRDMIRNSVLKSIITETTSYKAAMNSFFNKYQYLPGDWPQATTRWPFASVWPGYYTGDGNGDGVISQPCGNCSEGLWAWQQLMSEGLISGRYSGRQQSGNARLGRNIPDAPMKGTGYTIENWLRGKSAIVVSSTNGAAFNGSGRVNAAEVWGIDVKVDDGNAASGKVEARRGNGFSTGCIAGGEYDLDSDVISCRIWFFLD